MGSGNDKVKTIGLILEDAFTDFAHDIIHSISSMAAERKDLRLVVIAGRQDDSRDPYDMMHQYKIRYNLIYMMNEQYHFDGLLLTFPNLTRMQRDIYQDIPKVYLATELADELTVNYDDEMGIREAVDYLVRIKGVTRLCMLGGRDDNTDAQKRKEIFRQCLEDNGLIFTEDQYEKADMSTRTQEPAARLLARNPDTQAVFCVNDATAAGLYEALREAGKTPGEDVAVFAFDNGPLAANMNPPLASIGAAGMTLGQKALELLLDKMEGREASSRKVPTRLYGRESYEDEINGLTARELMNADSAFIGNFFDTCFYRYRNEVISSGAVNLRRLFHEIMTRMIRAMKSRYMSEEEFRDTCRLVEVMFDNGIMLYTDPNRFVNSISALQTVMSESGKAGFVGERNRRLLSLMKDKAIQFHGIRKLTVSGGYTAGRNRILEFMTWTTNYGRPGEDALEYLIRQMDRIGLNNAAMFLYQEPFLYVDGKTTQLPETMRLRCVLRNGELFVIPPERQECPVADIYGRSELPEAKRGYVSYPLFCGRYLFGLLVCEADERIFEIGEFMTFQLGRAIYMNWVNTAEKDG